MLAIRRTVGLGMSGCALTVFALLTACSSSEEVTVEGDVPIAYVKRSNNIAANPTDSLSRNSQGNLYILEKSSPSAESHNITGSLTGNTGDVSDPEVSYDGNKIVFSMRIDGERRWNIWEYDMTGLGNDELHKGTFRRITNTTQHDDVDPVYLPSDQGFIFSSNRQAKASSNTPGQPGYKALDEYEREFVINLHRMDMDGNNIEQISFNQSHDRNPVIRQNGRIMFSRWDHVGDRNHFAIFQAKPDGSDMFVLYGAHSKGNSFLHPRETEDCSLPNTESCYVITTLMPLSGTREGGALMKIDVTNYSEQNTPANATVPPNGGQQQVTVKPLNSGRGLSLNGRVTTPYPLWDGSNRVLVSFTPCQVRVNGLIRSCRTLTQEQIDILNDENRLISEDDPIRDNAPPAYSIFMFDMTTQTWRIVVSADPNYIFVDPIALMPRKEPNNLIPEGRDDTLLNDPRTGIDMGKMEVRSVYDTDSLGRMGSGSNSVLTAAEINAIPMIPPVDPDDTRPLVADIATIKNPINQTAYLGRITRMIRITKAVPPLPGLSREAIGETDFEMQQILGYAEVEPDGSFSLKAPADTPLALTTLDAEGRSFQSHTNWIQVRPGETRTCDGCHSPRRGAAINSGNIVGNHPNTLLEDDAQQGDTMAATRTRLDNDVFYLKPDMEYSDVWADTTVPGVVASPCFSVRYTGNINCEAQTLDPSRDLDSLVPVNGVINYPDHIQPIWARDRGADTCTTCHNDPAVLDLTGGIAGIGRILSYEELMLGDPLLDENGVPITETRAGVQVVIRGPSLVNVNASEGNAVGLARKSLLIEVIYGEQLMASQAARDGRPLPGGGDPDHSTMLNDAEKRLVVEWIDLGGQYYNSTHDQDGNLRGVEGVSETVFNNDIHQRIMTRCGSCHQAVGSDGSPLPGFVGNRYVLTDNAEGDFNVTLTMLNDVCNPDNSYLLSRPLSNALAPNPVHGLVNGLPVFANPGSDPDYQAIYSWIAAAGTSCP